MIRSRSILLAATVAALFAAACSSGGGDTLGGEEPFAPRATGPSTNTPSETPTGKPGGSTTPTPPVAVDPGPGKPSTGPGSAGSAAHKLFVETVHPKLASCGACHASGAQGAPKFIQTVADEAYLAMDARGLIKTDTLLLTKGPHAAGAAPALTSDQRSAIEGWLAREATERVGQASPVNLLQVAATCGDPAKFPTQALTTWLTTRRQNENGNQCTGCNNTQCASCHLSGEANVAISSGRTTDNQAMIDFYKSPDSISRFIGIDGTKLVASNAFKTKADATVADVRPISVPKHPQFIMTPAKQTAIDAYVQDIVTKFNAGTCPK